MSNGSEPLVSVVIPAHNAESTIRDTVDSVLCQTHVDFELLVIDDGSTDATGQIIAGITDSRVRYHSFGHAGPSSARNRGIECASGKFIAFLDADDLWLPGKLEAQIDVLRHNPNAALAFSWSDLIDESGAFIKRGNYVYPENSVYEQLIKWNFLDNGSTPMVRREALSEVGGFDEELRMAEEWDMWLRLAWRYPFVCVPEVQVLYRVSQGSSSSNIQEHVDMTLKVLRRALDRLPATRGRSRLERTAKANVYHYQAMRLVETSTNRRMALEAAGYWWRYVITTPNLLSALNRAVLIAGMILAILALPPRQLRRLRQSWSRLRAGTRP